MPRRSARRIAKADAQQQLDVNNDNVVMMVLPPNIAEELAKSGGQLTPELLTAIAHSQESIKPVPLQFEPSSSDQEEILGSTTSIKVTNSEPSPLVESDDGITTRNTRKTRGKAGSWSKNEAIDMPIITSSIPSDNDTPKRVTRSSPRKGNTSTPEESSPAKVKETRKRGGRPLKSADVALQNVQSKHDSSSEDCSESKTNNRVRGNKKVPLTKNTRNTRKSIQQTADIASKDVDECDSTPGVKHPVRNLRTRRSKATKPEIVKKNESESSSVLEPTSDNVTSENLSTLVDKIDEKLVVSEKAVKVLDMDEESKVNSVKAEEPAETGDAADPMIQSSNSELKDVDFEPSTVVNESTNETKVNDHVNKTKVNDPRNEAKISDSIVETKISDPTDETKISDPTDEPKASASSVTLDSCTNPCARSTTETLMDLPPVQSLNSNPLVDTVKDDALGISQEDLKHLDAVLASDHAKAILDNLPIEELLDAEQPIDQAAEVQTDMLDDIKTLMALPEDKDFFEALDSDSALTQTSQPITNEQAAINLSQIVFLDHSYFIDTRNEAKKSNEEESTATKERPKRSVSPVRRSQRQQDKIVKEQVEKIRAENAEAHRRELEELAKKDNVPKESPEGNEIDPSKEVKLPKDTEDIAPENTSYKEKEADETSDAASKKVIKSNFSEVDKGHIELLPKEAPKSLKHGHPAIVSNKTSHSSSDKETMKNVKQKGKLEKSEKESKKLHDRKDSTDNDVETKRKERRNSFGKSNVKKLVRRDSSHQKSEVNNDETKVVAVGDNHEAKKDKKPVKKDKSPGIAYLSLEPALFSQPDVLVTKNKQEDNSTKTEEEGKNIPKTPKETQKHVIESPVDVVPKQQKSEVVDPAFKSEAKEVKSVVDAVSKVESSSIPEVKPEVSLVKDAGDAIKSNVSTHGVNIKEDKPKNKHSANKSEDQAETLNDIIAELSGTTECITKPNKQSTTPKSSPVVITENKRKSEKIKQDEKAVVENIDDSPRKSYPKRENRRVPAHFEMYDQELIQAKPEKVKEDVSENQEMPNVKPVHPELTKPKVKKDAVKSKSENRKIIGPDIADLLEKEDSEDDEECASDDSWCSEDDPERLWCICRGPHDNRFMICCDGCEDWFHGSCVEITKKDGKMLAEQGKSWFCPICIKKNDEQVESSRKHEVDETKSDAKNDVKIKFNHKEMKKVLEKVDFQQKKSTSDKVEAHRKTSSSSVDYPAKSIKKSKNQPNECIASGCQKLFRTGSIFCSDECIKKYSNDCIRIIKKKSAAKSDDSSSEANQHNIFTVRDRESGKLVSSQHSPSEANLCAWLMEHQMCEVIQLKAEASPAPKKSKDLVRKSSSSDPAPVKKTASEASIRSNVSKMLFDALDNRLKNVTDMKMVTEEVKKISDTIEKELFNYYKDVGMKYKSKCRSLVFNIKDSKNHGLFRKVLKSVIKPHKLVRMTTEEMASKELAEWREREAKHSLEIIKQDEVDRMKKVLKQQKLQKIEIFEEKTADIDVVLETTKILKEAEKAPESEKIIDTASEHKSHLFDQNCSICTKKKEHSKKLKKSSKDEKDRKSSDSKSKSSSSHSKSKDSSHSKRRHSSSSSSHSKSKHSSSSSSSKVKSSSADHKKSSKSESKPKSSTFDPKIKGLVDSKQLSSTSDSKIKSLVDSMQPSSTSDSNIKSLVDSKKPSSPSSTSSPKVKFNIDSMQNLLSSNTQSPSDSKSVLESTEKVELDQSPAVNPVEKPEPKKGKCAWKGFICMPDVTKFVASAYQIYGSKGSFAEEPPNTIQVCGRIHPEQVYEYIGEIRTSPTREVVVIQFDTTSVEEKSTYTSFYEYLNVRKRFGVVSSFSSQVKDFYIMPLAAHTPLPNVLKQLEGPGLLDEESNILLGILVVKSYKRPSFSVNGSIPSKVPKIVKPSEELNRSYTPPINDVSKIGIEERNSHTPPLAPPKSKAPVDEPYEPSFTPPKSKAPGDEPYEPSFTPPQSKGPGDEPYEPSYTPPKSMTPGDEPYEPSFTPPLGDNDDNIPYSPSHATVLEDEGDKPYDPEESEKDLQKLTDLQNKLQQKDNATQLTTDEVTDIRSTLGNNSLTIGGTKPSSDLDKQRLLLIELTKRVEEQRMSLEKQMINSNIPNLPTLPAKPKTEETISQQIIAPNTDGINLPPNLAEILKTVQDKTKEALANKSIEITEPDSSTSGDVSEDKISESFAHYSPDDDYGKHEDASSPCRTPPLSEAVTVGSTTPPRKSTKPVSFTPPKAQVDPRLSGSCDKPSVNKVSRKDPRHKSTSLKNMTESELVERARKQLEDMNANAPHVPPPQMMPPPPLPPGPPPQMFSTNFPLQSLPPSVAQFPPQLNQPPPPPLTTHLQPPPVPEVSWNPPVNPEAMSSMYHDNVTAAVLDYVKCDRPVSTWEPAPPMLHKRRKKVRRQHEHWRGLRKHWQNQPRYDDDHGPPPPMRSHDGDVIPDGESYSPKRQRFQDRDDRRDLYREHNYRGKGSFKNRDNFRFNEQKNQGQTLRSGNNQPKPTNPDSSSS